MEMTHRHIEDAHPSVVAEAENGEHKGWSSFDTKLEGARFHLIHGLVSGQPFDPAEAERLLAELESLAQSYGYASTDSYLVDAYDRSDEDISSNPFLSSQRENLFDEDGGEDPYFIEVRASERALLKAAATDDARSFLGADSHAAGWQGAWGSIHARMQDAFRRGRDLRAAQTFSAPAP